MRNLGKPASVHFSHFISFCFFRNCVCGEHSMKVLKESFENLHFWGISLKALANEDTLFLMMFLGLRKLGSICCGLKMFLNKIRNIFCVPDTKCVSATNVARAGKPGNICVGNNVSSFTRALTIGRRVRCFYRLLVVECCIPKPAISTGRHRDRNVW